MKAQLIPGWCVLVALAVICQLLSQQVVISDKHPLEASALAVIIGIILGSTLRPLSLLQPGFKASEKLLVLGIVLMGASLDISNIAGKSLALIVIIVTTMLVGFFATFYLALSKKLSTSLSLLLASGTTICGGTAVAILAPIVKAKPEETGYAIATVTLWGIVTLLLYPAIGLWLGVDDLQFGIFAGTAIHSTPQVVGAAFIFSDLAGQTATAVKLLRNCLIAPLAFAIAIWIRNREKKQGKSGDHEATPNVAAAFPWFLFGFFLMSWCANQGYISPQGVSFFEWVGKFLIVTAMAGVGVNTDLGAIRAVGFGPLLVGLVGAVIVALLSASLIWVLIPLTGM